MHGTPSPETVDGSGGGVPGRRRADGRRDDSIPAVWRKSPRPPLNRPGGTGTAPGRRPGRCRLCRADGRRVDSESVPAVRRSSLHPPGNGRRSGASGPAARGRRPLRVVACFRRRPSPRERCPPSVKLARRHRARAAGAARAPVADSEVQTLGISRAVVAESPFRETGRRPIPLRQLESEGYRAQQASR